MIGGRSMNEQNNFALIPKPSSAVEKAAPGAKRILSEMVKDTLVLRPGNKPVLSVLIADYEPPLKQCGEWIEFFSGVLGQQYDLKFTLFEDANELLRLCHNDHFKFDLIVMYLDLVRGKGNLREHFNSQEIQKIESLAAKQSDQSFGAACNMLMFVFLLAKIKIQYRKPIVTFSGGPWTDEWVVKEIRQSGIEFFCVPFQLDEMRTVITRALDDST
jgi:hypothetical protein